MSDIEDDTFRNEKKTSKPTQQPINLSNDHSATLMHDGEDGSSKKKKIIMYSVIGGGILVALILIIVLSVTLPSSGDNFGPIPNPPGPAPTPSVYVDPMQY